MRRLVLGIAVAVTSLMPVLGVADDQQIADFIKSRLHAEQSQGNLKGFNVDMRVERGTVWFKGHVSNQTQEMTILKAAQQAGHLGVVQVVDDIEVVTTQPAAPQPAQPATQETMVAPSQPIQQQSAGIAPTQTTQTVPNQTMESQEAPTQATQTQATQTQTQTQATQTQTQTTQDTQTQPIQMQTQSVPGQNVSTPNATQPVPYQNAAYQRQPQMQNQPMPLGQVSNQQVTPAVISAAPINGAPQGFVTGGQPLPFSSTGGNAMPQGGPAMPVSFANTGSAPSQAPNLPGYAWPGYAANPNYAAVSYPKQYSASAWPYIGPFYPYPQVPLGWRKVSLEWDDGWWMIDFHDK